MLLDFEFYTQWFDIKFGISVIWLSRMLNNPYGSLKHWDLRFFFPELFCVCTV